VRRLRGPLRLDLKLERSLEICLVDIPVPMTPEDVAETLYHDHRRLLETAHALIVRPRVWQPIAGKRLEEVARPFRERVPERPLYILHSSDFELQLTPSLQPAVDSPLSADATTTLTALRQAELFYYLSNSPARLTPPAKSVFRLPSRALSRSFVRVGSVQLSKAILDAFFFWLLPSLSSCHVVLADTWTISSIALNAARLLDRYRPGEEPTRVEILSSYADAAPGAFLSHVATSVRLRLNPGETGVVLISALATGRLLSRFRGALALNDSHEAFRYISLYDLGASSDIPYLCSLPEAGEERFQPLALSQAQKRTFSIIEIDPVTYFPSLTVDDQLAPIRKRHTRDARDFFTNYQGIGALCVHRNAVDRGGQNYRHHAFFVDVARLLTSDLFVSKLDALTRSAVSGLTPAMVITPPHEAGEAMAARVAHIIREGTGIEVRIVVSADLRAGAVSTPTERIAALGREDTLIVVDDVSVSGRRLTSFQSNLRTLGFRGHLLYIVGVARPDDPAAWDDRCRTLRERVDYPDRRHDVTCVEKILLPDWLEDDCPWCFEESLLHGLRYELRESAPAVFQRYQELVRAREGRGLTESVFWCVTPPTFTSGAIFLERAPLCSEGDLVVCIASALERMRHGSTTTPDSPLGASFPVSIVLQPGDYLGNTFTDPSIRLGILRASRLAELVCSREWREDKRSERCLELLQSRQGCFDRELVLAAASGKLRLLENWLEAMSDPVAREIAELLLRLHPE
jgi:hypothetical protein